MATLSTLRTRIAAKLSNGNLVDPTSSQIDDQINSTIDFYKTYFFWFQEGAASLTTTADDRFLDISSVTDFNVQMSPGALVLVDNDYNYPLEHVAPIKFDQMRNNVSNGLPQYYTYRNSKFELFPTPDDAYTVEFYYYKTFADLSADGDENDFTINAARLAEYKTLEDLCRDYRNDDRRAASFERQVLKELREIRRQSAERKTTGNLLTEDIIDLNDYYFYYHYY